MENFELIASVSTPFSNFQVAAKAVLKLLHDRLGFQLWMLTRVEQDDWIVLAADDHGYGVDQGDVFRWSDSFCSRMVHGLGPQVAPRAGDVLAYATAPIADQMPICAYIGVPLRRRDGTLFGTLCAIDPQPQMDSVQEELPLIELQGQLLTTILHQELEAQEKARRLERAELESQSDWLTGLYNRRGWERLLEMEEARCKRYGDSAGIIMIDLDDLKVVNDTQGHAAGDRLLQEMAGVLQGVSRSSDVVARLGGDEFAVMAVESNRSGTKQLAERIQNGLGAIGVSASIGWAVRNPKSNLQETLTSADQRMYQQKVLRKALRQRTLRKVMQ